MDDPVSKNTKEVSRYIDQCADLLNYLAETYVRLATYVDPTMRRMADVIQPMLWQTLNIGGRMLEKVRENNCPLYAGVYYQELIEWCNRCAQVEEIGAEYIILRDSRPREIFHEVSA